MAGLLIIGALLSLDGTAIVKNWEDWAVDVMIRLNSSLARMTGERHGRADLEFTFLDMDEHSFRAKSWNEPFHVPRDKLLKLIEFAEKGKASMIVVDVNLGKKGINPDADKALVDYILNYPESAPPLILMRAKQNKAGQPNGDLGAFRATIFAGLNRTNIHFAQPLFQRDKKDGVVRNWILFNQGCFKGRGLALPSVQLLAYALLKDRREGGTKNIGDLNASMHANRPFGCSPGEKNVRIRRPVVIGKTVFRQQRLGERLIYSIPWPKTGPDSRDLKSIPAIFVTDRGFKDVSDVAGRVTLIGASYGASHDLHLTPLGLMPGTLIILNAIKSLNLFEQISPPPLYIRLAFLLSFITLMSYVFSRFGNLVKFLVVTAIVFIFFVPISFWFFKYGVWFDFGILLLGIKLQHSVSEFLEVRELKRLRTHMQHVEQVTTDQTDSRDMITPAPGEKHKSNEVDVHVRVKRAKDGTFLIKTASNGAATREFELDVDGLKQFPDGYLLALKDCPNNKNK
ncbi:MAG: CHASE2 domain-containing protein [Hyphomicrobiaceae bacterium]|nr:CHASE2 domain-containing protein [Hyphomicrobiaceae bacterium]